MKHARLLSFLLAALLVLSSCSIGMADSLEDAAEVSVDTSEMFTDRDLRRDLSRSVFAKQCAIRIDKQQKECYNNAAIDNGIII